MTYTEDQMDGMDSRPPTGKATGVKRPAWLDQKTVARGEVVEDHRDRSGR